jgi:hypothetical protein
VVIGHLQSLTLWASNTCHAVQPLEPGAGLALALHPPDWSSKALEVTQPQGSKILKKPTVPKVSPMWLQSRKQRPEMAGLGEHFCHSGLRFGARR